MPRQVRHKDKSQLGHLNMQRISSTKPPVYSVVAVKGNQEPIQLGMFDGIDHAKAIADENTVENVFCIVYSEQNRIVYSTER